MTQAGGDPVIAAGCRAKNALMIAFAFTLPYHVMRTAAAAGLRVHVLGNGASRGLRMSRCCRAYHETRFGGDPEALLAEIGELVRRHAIDIILPSDDVSTRLLAELADRLPVRATPLPDLATFDLLNDKGSFTRFCLQNGVRAPQGWLFDTVAGLRDALDRGTITLPITVKPTNRSGGVGVMHLREPADLALLDTVDYRPILAQRHISGVSVSITMLCDRGRVLAYVAQERDSAHFRTFADADLLVSVTRLAAVTGYHGVANFDAVLSDDDGLAYLVECNPRFWYSIYLVMIAGLNFVELALAPPAEFPKAATLAGGAIRLSLRETLTTPRRASRLDWKYLFYCLGDPLAFVLQRAKSFDDTEVAVPVDRMTESAPIGRFVAA
jgi:biotin carboxylase